MSRDLSSSKPFDLDKTILSARSKWAKFEALAEGAPMASDRLWKRNSAAAEGVYS